MIEQGLLSRVLAVMPEPGAGNRAWRRLDDDDRSKISNFSSRVTKFLGTAAPCAARDARELQPRTLKLEAEAEQAWIKYHDLNEADLAPGGDLASIQHLPTRRPSMPRA